MDFAKLVVFQASMGPQKPALGYTGGVATYGVLAGAVSRAIESLDLLGLARGQLAAVDMRNPFHHTALLLALALKGIASVSVQASFAIHESGLKVDALLADRFAKPAPGLAVTLVNDSWFDHDPKTKPDYARLLAAPGMSDVDVLRVVFSSGATGRPKSVGITPAVLSRRFANASFTYGGGSSNSIRVMSMMGFSTLPGFMSMLGALAGGGMACFAPNAAEALQIVNIFQVSILSATVHQLHKLIDAHGAAPALPSLQALIVGGSFMPAGLIAEARARLCSNVMLGYGTTEIGSVTHVNASAVEAMPAGCAGPVLPWAKLEIVDADRNCLPPGQHGAIRVRSSETALYVGATIADRQALDGDWFYPGDVGHLRDDGMVFLTGRATEVINRGGTIVAPDLLDDVLVTHPSVTDAASFGATNALGIEEIWAAVVPASGYDPAVLLRFCRERFVDKAPDRLIVVDAIPRTDTGKVRRARLREIATVGQHV